MPVVSDNEARLRLTGKDQSAAASRSVANNMRQLEAQTRVAMSNMGRTTNALTTGLVGLGARYLGVAAAAETARQGFLKYAGVDERLRRVQLQAGATADQMAKLRPVLDRLSREHGIAIEEMIAGYDLLRERGRMSIEETAKIFPHIVAGARGGCQRQRDGRHVRHDDAQLQAEGRGRRQGHGHADEGRIRFSIKYNRARQVCT